MFVLVYLLSKNGTFVSERDFAMSKKFLLLYSPLSIERNRHNRLNRYFNLEIIDGGPCGRRRQSGLVVLLAFIAF